MANDRALKIALRSTQFEGLKVLTSEGITQAYKRLDITDKVTQGKSFDQLTETEKDELMKQFITEISARL